jgi:hypothetical protein
MGERGERARVRSYSQLRNALVRRLFDSLQPDSRSSRRSGRNANKLQNAPNATWFDVFTELELDNTLVMAETMRQFHISLTCDTHNVPRVPNVKNTVKFLLNVIRHQGSNSTVMEYTFAILKNINHDNAPVVAATLLEKDKSGFALLLETLVNGVRCPGIVLVICSTLVDLMDGNAEVIQAFAVLGGHLELLDVLKKYNRNVDVVVYVCRLLVIGTTYGADARSFLTCPYLPEAMIHVLGTYSQSHQLVNDACFLLIRILSSYPDTISQETAVCVYVALVTVLERNMTEPEVLHWVYATMVCLNGLHPGLQYPQP